MDPSPPAPTDFEDLLASEGLAPYPDHCPWGTGRADPLPHHGMWADIPSDHPGPYSAAPDHDEVCRLEALAYWLPPADRDLLQRVRRGDTQRQIGEHYGLSQPGIHWRLQRALDRLRALHGAPALPDDREAVRGLVTAHWAPAPGRAHPPSTVASWAVGVCSSWRFARRTRSDGGIPQSTTAIWVRHLCSGTRPARAPELAPVRHLFGIIRAHRAQPARSR